MGTAVTDGSIVHRISTNYVMATLDRDAVAYVGDIVVLDQKVVAIDTHSPASVGGATGRAGIAQGVVLNEDIRAPVGGIHPGDHRVIATSIKVVACNVDVS